MGLPEPRYLEPATAVEVTDVVIQNRHLFRPSDEEPAQSGASLTLGFDRQPPRG